MFDCLWRHLMVIIGIMLGINGYYYLNNQQNYLNLPLLNSIKSTLNEKTQAKCFDIPENFSLCYGMQVGIVRINIKWVIQHS